MTEEELLACENYVKAVYRRVWSGTSYWSGELSHSERMVHALLVHIRGYDPVPGTPEPLDTEYPAKVPAPKDAPKEFRLPLPPETTILE